MPYFVIAPDGQEYGPAEVETLKQWVSENRLSPQTMLKDQATGQRGMASQVPGLFPPPSAVQTPAPAGADPTFAPGYQPPAGMQPDYSTPPAPQRPSGQWAQPASVNRMATMQDASADRAQLMQVVFRIVLALVLVSVLRFAGLVSSAYACYYAFTNAGGNRYGIWMIVMAIATILTVAGVWIYRAQTGHYGYGY